jgi:hypothetical protein
MISMCSVRFLGCCALLAGALAMPHAAKAQESFFGRLFGAFDPPPAQPSYGGVHESGPLRLDVRPMRSPRRNVQRPPSARVARLPRPLRPLRPARPNTPPANTEAYARLNPATNPKWYLEDPTLRRGDIVVLEQGARVFVGHAAAAHRASEFQAPSEVSELPIAERERIEKLAVVNTD